MIDTLAQGFKQGFSQGFTDPLSYAKAHTKFERRVVQGSRAFVFSGITLLTLAILVAAINYEYFVAVVGSAVLLAMDDIVVAVVTTS